MCGPKATGYIDFLSSVLHSTIGSTEDIRELIYGSQNNGSDKEEESLKKVLLFGTK